MKLRQNKIHGGGLFQSNALFVHVSGESRLIPRGFSSMDNMCLFAMAFRGRVLWPLLITFCHEILGCYQPDKKGNYNLPSLYSLKMMDGLQIFLLLTQNFGLMQPLTCVHACMRLPSMRLTPNTNHNNPYFLNDTSPNQSTIC